MTDNPSSQVDNANTSLQSSVSSNECVSDKPPENSLANDNQSAVGVTDGGNENAAEENKIISTPLGMEISNSFPEKVKRRSGGKKHRAGRNRKRRWKPYSKLSWIERKKLEEREARKAQRVRDEMAAYGLVLAPYNTTQFLMNDHNIQEPDYGHLHNGHKHKDSNEQGDSSDEYYSYSDDNYINQQFMEDYENYHDEYMDSLSQEELVYQWVDFEDKIEELEKKLKDLRNERKLLGEGGLDAEAEMAKIQVFREEIQKITIENSELADQNVHLKNTLYRYS